MRLERQPGCGKIKLLAREFGKQRQNLIGLRLVHAVQHPLRRLKAFGVEL